jgi:outer membrane protein TolC
MKQFGSAVLLGRAAVIAALPVLVFATYASAQFGAPAPQATQATPLPLSGRSAQGGGVVASQAPVPSTTTSVNTLNPTVSVQGAYSGSTRSTARLPFSGKLALAEAIQRGMQYNLGAVGMVQAVLQARGQARAARSALLPNLSADVNDTEETFNLRTIGFNFSVPGFSLPAVLGPFNVMDIRVRLSQKIADFTSLNNYRSAQEVMRAGQLSAADAQDLVVLAVAGAYLQVLAAKARLESAQAQLVTSKALFERTKQQLTFGRAARIDVNRSQVEVLLDQQRLATLQNDLAKQKINLARLTGLPPNADFELSNDIPFAPAPSLSLEDAIQQALAQRADLKAAESQVRAAERALAAARAERYPSASASADYGAIGGPSQLRPTYTVSATLNVPIWNGGRTGADIQQAQAALAQRRAELEDTRGQIEGEVRNAYLDLEAASNQVKVAQQNIDLMGETLHQTRQRFEAGVSENIEVVQSQESVAGANLDYIDSVFAHNLAKLSLARALGNAAHKLEQFLPVQQPKQQ